MSLAVLLTVALATLPIAAFEISLQAQQKQNTKLPKPRRLDDGLTWKRDPVTGELKAIPAGGATNDDGTNGTARAETPDEVRAISVTTQIVPVTCSVIGADGVAVRGLQRADFRVFDDGVQQPLTYFDASTESASVAIVIDASPSVLRESDEMKNAARALVDALSSSDQTAIVDFSAHTYLQLPFSSDWGTDPQSRRARGRTFVAGRYRRLQYLRGRVPHRARAIRRPHWTQSHCAADGWPG